MTQWTAEFFRNNRLKLAEKTAGGLVALAGNLDMQRRGDMAHRFAQDASFWYFTGINEPGWRFIFDGTRQRCWLVRPDVDDIHRVFEGGMSDQEAIDISGADEIVSWRDHERLLRQLAKQHSTAYGLMPHRDSTMSSVENPARSHLSGVLRRIFASVSDASKDISSIRAIKTDAEIAAIRSAVGLTVEAFEIVRSRLVDLSYEYEIEAEFSYIFRCHNATHAYEPIVASGRHACTLHYARNDAKRQAHSAVLLDIGAERDGYCADITRTYAWGKPSKRFAEIHAALQAAHKEIIDSIAPYMPIQDYQRTVDTIMRQCMIRVGLLTDEHDSRYRTYFPHAISHGLGIDVHDSLGGSRTLDPGMVLTVEPGIYVPEQAIGMRIEDDILITKSGVDNMSAALSTALDV